MLLRFFAICLMLFSASAWSADTLAGDVIGQLYGMRSVYQTAYAPAQWKKFYANYDLQENFQRALGEVARQTPLTIPATRLVLNNFVYAMKDYHVSISYYATEAATLPFVVKGAGDRFFLAYIDRTKLPEVTFPFQGGGELVQCSNQAALFAVRAVQNEFTANVPGTDRARAELSLTSRRAARGMKIPNGPIALTFRKNGTEELRDIQLLWDYTPESIFPRGDVSSLFASEKAGPSPFHPMMVAGEDTQAAENPHAIGARKTFTPDLGPKVFETEETNTFHAYIYKTPERRLIGYVRIPSYSTSDYAKAVSDFAAIIERFEATTDSMVIDQVNNPGGSVFYLYALASMLSGKPLATPRHRMSITQAEVTEALGEIKKLADVTDDASAQKALAADDYHGYPKSYQMAQFIRQCARFLVSEWEAGRKLSRPYWIAGVDQINPAPVHYTKGILVLTNQLDFSGGDFFPAILQDNKRVTILGTRTAGAGGYVQSVSIPNNIGVQAFRLTASIAERLDGNPIENLGVTPNILYEMKAEDYTGNYGSYVNAIRQALATITP